MKNEGISVKTIVAIGIGAAVFVILGRFIVIPTGFQIRILKQLIHFSIIICSIRTNHRITYWTNWSCN